jgi:ribosomal protein L16 Arg81 hydroxylase
MASECPSDGTPDGVRVQVHAQHARGPFDAAPPSSFFDDAEEVTLRPGSVLYVPAGMWHRVQCVEDSVSINIRWAS